MYRTHNLGQLRIENAGEKVVLSGWVANVRDMNHFLFLVLRDREGITQVIIDKENSPEGLFEKAKSLNNEDVVKVTGTVRERSSKNKDMPTGDIEVDADTIDITNKNRQIIALDSNLNMKKSMMH